MKKAVIFYSFLAIVQSSYGVNWRVLNILRPNPAYTGQDPFSKINKPTDKSLADTILQPLFRPRPNRAHVEINPVGQNCYRVQNTTGQVISVKRTIIENNSDNPIQAITYLAPGETRVFDFDPSTKIRCVKDPSEEELGSLWEKCHNFLNKYASSIYRHTRVN